MQSKIDTLALFPILDLKLNELLKSLTKEEWEAQTVAKLWKVKDVASHLLDGNLRGLSISRDAYFGESPSRIDSYQDLVAFLNGLNLSWTNATKRLSPKVLIDLLESTGKSYREHLATLDLSGQAIFSVAWAGQEISLNWFHIAREYTEKFLHQQQIRDAVYKQSIMTRELFYPFLETFMYAFPHTFRNIKAPLGTIVTLKVNSDIGGQWNIIKNDDGWALNNDREVKANAELSLDPDTAWKLFSKSWKPEQVVDKVNIKGDAALALHALNLVAVMA